MAGGWEDDISQGKGVLVKTAKTGQLLELQKRYLANYENIPSRQGWKSTDL